MEGRRAFQKSHTIKLKGVTISILKMVMVGVPPPPTPPLLKGKMEVDGGGKKTPAMQLGQSLIRL